MAAEYWQSPVMILYKMTYYIINQCIGYLFYVSVRLQKSNR